MQAIRAACRTPAQGMLRVSNDTHDCIKSGEPKTEDRVVVVHRTETQTHGSLLTFSDQYNGVPKEAGSMPYCVVTDEQ